MEKSANDFVATRAYGPCMKQKQDPFDPKRQVARPHHIPAWAELHGLKQVDLAEKLGADKSLVSRWFSGTSPGPNWQKKIAALFGIKPEHIFRHPDDVWFSQFKEGRSPQEMQRIRQMLEAGFPRSKDAH